MRTLLESLLDDIDGQLEDQTVLIQDKLNELNNDEEIKSLFFGQRDIRFLSDSLTLFDYNKDLKQLIISPENCNRVFLKITEKTPNIIKKFEDIGIDVNSLYFGNPKNKTTKQTHFAIIDEVISNKDYTKDIYVSCSNRLNLCANKIENINIHLDGLHYIYLNDKTNSNPSGMKCKNVNILFENSSKFQPKQIKFDINTGGLPDLDGLSSNAEVLTFYDAFLFDNKDVLNVLNNLIDFNVPVEIYDFNKDSSVDVKFKNIKNINAKVNNKKRYTFKTNCLNLKPNAKISDLFNLSKLKSINIIKFSDNNTNIFFYKDPKIFEFHWGRISDKQIAQMSDGWYMGINKKA